MGQQEQSPRSRPGAPHPDPTGIGVDKGYTIVRISDIHANGVFATRRIPKRTTLYRYVGERISKAEAARRLEEDKARGTTYLFELDETTELDGRVGGNDSTFINHSCDPNCDVEVDGDRILIITIRDVAEGEEITFDYNFDPTLGPLNAPCRCGSGNCRGFIVGEEHVGRLKRSAATKDEEGRMRS